MSFQIESSSEFIRPGCCAVIGVLEEILLAKGITLPEHSDQVGLVVIAEVRGNKHVLNEVMEHIQTVVAEEHGVTIASIVLIKERSICKTTSVSYPKHHKQAEVPEIYRLAARTKGVFINPAFIEPFGLTLIEAAAYGLPMVATKNGGPVDI